MVRERSSLTFTKDDGSRARPGFRDVEHMNETMIANHNRVVGPSDCVCFLGDVGFNKATVAAVRAYLASRAGLAHEVAGLHGPLWFTPGRAANRRCGWGASMAPSSSPG